MPIPGQATSRQPSSLSTDQIMQVALDLAGLSEPTPDSMVHVAGDGIRRVLFGIDIGPAELHVAHSLGFDCVVSHHPWGRGLLDMWKIHSRHVELMCQAGVSEDVARRAVEGQLADMRCAASAENYDRAPSIARLLGLPFLSIHNVLDRVGHARLTNLVASVQHADPDASVGDLVRAIEALPEVQHSSTVVEIAVGSATATAGRTIVGLGPGGSGGFPVASAYYEAGVQTLVWSQIRPGDLRQVRAEAGGNLVITGHMAGDMVGCAPFLQALEERGVEIARVGSSP